MTWLKSKFWPWLKKWWKWILFPVGILGLVGAAIAGTRVVNTVSVDPKKLDDIEDERRQKVSEADAERDAKLQELAEKHQSRLEQISDDQEKELEGLAEKPIEEVVAWFDQF